MLLRLFWTYLKIGTFTLGGGYAMLPLIQHEIVEKQHLIDEKEFVNMIALAQAAPGLIAVFFTQLKHIAAVEAVFKGLRPAVVALIAAAVIKMARNI